MRVGCEESVRTFLKGLQRLAYELVIERAEIQQLEKRGQRVIECLFGEFISAPEKADTTNNLGVLRKVCGERQHREKGMWTILLG